MVEVGRLGLGAETAGGVALRVAVDQQDAALEGAETGAEVDGGGGLADPALLVRDGENRGHRGQWSQVLLGKRGAAAGCAASDSPRAGCCRSGDSSGGSSGSFFPDPKKDAPVGSEAVRQGRRARLGTELQGPRGDHVQALRQAGGQGNAAL